MKTAILGATGLVGRTLLALLAEREWARGAPLLLTSASSAGRELDFRGRAVACAAADGADLTGIDIALFSAGAAASRRYGPALAGSGAWVIDNSSAFRLEEGVPLVVPEANGDLLPHLARVAGGSADAGRVASGGIIANPNCSTIQIAVALAPLEAAFGLRAVHCTTLQAVSGAGQAGVDEMAAQVRAAGDAQRDRLAAGRLRSTAPPADSGIPVPEVFPRRIAFNAVPAIGPAEEDGSFREETKVLHELRKILDRPDLAVTCTAVRVPVWSGHCVAVRVVLARRVTPDEAREAMSAGRGLRLEEGPHAYATPAEWAGDGGVSVGRLRGESGRDDVLLFWVVADNLLKGAALNALQIADLLVAG